MALKVARTVVELKETLATAKSQLVGFVPTMGALHAGHAALLERCRAENDVSVLSIFVNPLQFGPNEDLSRYPRPIEKDLAVAEAQKTDVVFLPSVAEMFPKDFSTAVEENDLSKMWCGEFRPGHFRGVTTVVLRLFNIVEAKNVYFGQKDLQQCLVIQKMVTDLAVPVNFVRCPTVRESDGLAMSSRNQYLNAADRAVAPSLYQKLQSLGNSLQRAALSEHPRLLRTAREALAAKGFAVEYLDLRALPNLSPPQDPSEEWALATAVRLGSTRLIDNIIINKFNGI